MTAHHYDNEVHPDNVYGHTLDLLRRHLPSSGDPEGAGIHLDIACGFGNIAEPIRDELGVEYVGLDLDLAELEALTGRGFETHHIDLMAPDLATRITDVIGRRRVRSISFLDGLEHLTDGSTALSVISGVLADHDALLVTSVPNVTHLDVATKALLGRWDYTPSGLLDRTHFQLWSRDSLEAAFDLAGLEVIDRHDVDLEHSDQHFPPGHVGLSSATSLGSWLSALRSQVAPNRFTNQFVWASRAGRPTARSLSSTYDETASPFLSVLVRSDGQRPEALDETLLSLAAQTETDFEAIVLVRATGAELETIQGLLDEHPATLRERLRVVPVAGTPAEELNTGLASARGTYVAFSDDVTWLGHWVESARDLAASQPGRCVRGLVLEQDVASVQVGAVVGLRATSSPVRHGGRNFSLLEHVSTPLASLHGIAFPRSLFEDLGVRVDDTWGSVAVRRHLLRAIELAGVVEVGEIIAIHQRHEGTPVETEDDLARLIDEIDAGPYLMPAGAARRAIEGSVPITEKLEEARESVATLDQLVEMKDTHIANIERTLAARNDEVDRLRAVIAKRDAQVEKLRGRVKKLKATPDDASTSETQRRSRFRFRP